MSACVTHARGIAMEWEFALHVLTPSLSRSVYIARLYKHGTWMRVEVEPQLQEGWRCCNSHMQGLPWNPVDLAFVKA